MRVFEEYYKDGILCVASKPNDKIPSEKYKGLKHRTEEELKELDKRLEKGQIGIAVLTGEVSNLIALDIDTDDSILLAEIQESKVIKRGRKGETRFFTYNNEEPLIWSRKVKSNDNKEITELVEIKSQSKTGTGQLTHIPPSIHPQTKKPYEWRNFHLKREYLEDLDLNELSQTLNKHGFKLTSATKEEVIIPEDSDLEVKPKKKDKSPQIEERDKELNRQLLSCMPCNIKYTEWMNSAFVTRNTLGDIEGRTHFEAYVSRCDEYNTKESTWLEVKGFFTSNVPSKPVKLGTLINIAKKYDIDVAAIQRGINPEHILTLNKDASEMATILMAEIPIIGNTPLVWKQNHYEEPIIRSNEYLMDFLEQEIIKRKWNFWTDKESGLVELNNLETRHFVEIRRCFKGKLDRGDKNREYDSWMDGSKTYMIALENGLLNYKTGELIDFTPQYINNAVLPFEYNEKATCPIWLEALDEYFESHMSAIKTLKQMFGVLIGEEKFRKRKILLLKGDAGSGKSSILTIMSMLAGTGYTISADKISMRGSQFVFGNAVGKRLLALDDYDISTLYNSEIERFKGATGSAPVHIEKKGIQPFTAILSLLPVITTNESPVIGSDSGGGFLDRLYCLEASPIKRRNLDFFELIRKELAGVFNWALEGLREISVGSQSIDKDPQNTYTMASMHESYKTPIDVFIDEHYICGIETTQIIPAAEIYNKFETWRLSNSWVEGNYELRNARKRQIQMQLAKALEKRKSVNCAAPHGLRGWTKIKNKAPDEFNY